MPKIDGAVAVGRRRVFLVQHRVEVGEHGGRVGVVDGGRAQRVAGQRGHRRGPRRPCRTRRRGRSPTAPRRAGTGRRSRRRPRRRTAGVVVRRRRRSPGSSAARAGAGVLLQGRRQPLRARSSDASARCLAGAQQLAARRRGGRVASKTVVRISSGCPSSPVLSTEVTSTGSRLPSARTSSSAIPPTSPCMLQQRREVGLVVDPAADGQQVGEASAGRPARRGRSRASPAGGVDLRDRAVRQGGQVAARRVLVQVLGAVLQQRARTPRPSAVGAHVVAGRASSPSREEGGDRLRRSPPGR